MYSTRNSYAAGHFEFLVDGHEPNAYVKSVKGGWSRAKPNQTSGKNDPRMDNLTTTSEIDPITVELGITGSKDMLRWVQQAWRGEKTTRHGQITFADFNMSTMLEHWFFDAMITQTAFPALDGSAKDGGYLTCTLQPAHAETKRNGGTPGPKISGAVSPKQKMWSPSQFRFTIDGIPGVEYTNKLDAISVSLSTKPHFNGTDRLPERAQTFITFPNIKGSISMAYGNGLFDWFESYIRSKDGAGISETRARRSGSIDFLTPDRKDTIFSICLEGLLPIFVGAEAATANADQIKRLEFELSVRSMKILGSSLLGFY